MPKNATNESTRSHTEFCLIATTMPIGIAIAQAKIMLLTASTIVLKARAAISEVTLTR